MNITTHLLPLTILLAGCSHSQPKILTVKDPVTKKKVKTAFQPIPNRRGKYCPFQEKTIHVFQNNGYGEFISCENNYIVINGRMSSGHPTQNATPDGTFNVWQKRFEHDSTLYPSTDGTRNMDRSLYFKGTVAIHKGNPYARSHGCVHVGSKNADILYEWAPIGTKVIVENY